MNVKNILGKIVSRGPVAVVSSVVVSVLFVTGLVSAATTITGSLITLENGETISNATDEVVTIDSDTLVLVGTASTSAIRVGDETATPVINGLVHGFCSMAADATSFTASTTKYIECTTSVTGALTTSDRIFVQATSSLDTPFVIQAASSTGVSTISLRILNTGLDGLADATLGATSFNFWAVR